MVTEQQLLDAYTDFQVRWQAGGVEAEAAVRDYCTFMQQTTLELRTMVVRLCQALGDTKHLMAATVMTFDERHDALLEAHTTLEEQYATLEQEYADLEDHYHQVLRDGLQHRHQGPTPPMAP